MECSKFADEVAEVCLTKYQTFPKKGKPIVGEEWTLLSAIVSTLDGKFSVVAMATGSKCLGRNKMSPSGDILNDSHAEVLARRCFLRYIYDQINVFKLFGSSDVIESCNENLYQINPKIKFHFFTSHVPCGDSSIIPKTAKLLKRKESCLTEVTVAKQRRVEKEGTSGEIQNNYALNLEPACTVDGEDVGEVVEDVYRTGAKCVDGEDSRQPGASYHTVGVVRTKPGRGDPTLSVSCSDKLARWIHCGLQGSLLSLLLSEPVCLSSVVIGGGGPCSLSVLERALLTRLGTSNHQVQLLRSSLVFPAARYLLPASARPCPSAILWAHVRHKPLEVSVDGRRQGTTKKSKDNGRLMVCKLELFKLFMSLASESYSGKTYREVKESAVNYNNISSEAKRKLQGWTVKPTHLENFTLDIPTTNVLNT